MRVFKIILFVLFPLISAEYYCRQEDKFKACRRCPDLSESCEEPLADQECQCDHIQLYVGKYQTCSVTCNRLQVTVTVTGYM